MSKVDIKTSIDVNIKQNNNQEITGTILNSVLNSMVDDYAEQVQVDGLSASKLDKSSFNTFKADNQNEIDAIKDQMKNYKPIEVINNGTINNAPDEEDLTSVDDLIKFKDRSAVNGMGYIILRNGDDLATKMQNANTIYEIRYDFDLGGDTIDIGANSVLKFKGGSLANGTIKGSNTTFDNTNVNSFSNIDFDGTFNSCSCCVEWFSEDDTESIKKAVDFCASFGGEVVLSAKTYTIDTSIDITSLQQGIIIRGQGLSTKIVVNSGISAFSGRIFWARFQDICFDGVAITNSNLAFDCVSHHIEIQHCYFYNFGVAVKIGGVIVTLRDNYFADNSNGIVFYKKENINTCVLLERCHFIRNGVGVDDNYYNEIGDTNYPVGTIKLLTIKDSIFEQNTRQFNIVNVILVSLERNWFESSSVASSLKYSSLVQNNNNHEPSDKGFSPTNIATSRTTKIAGDVTTTQLNWTKIVNGSETAKLSMAENVSANKHYIEVYSDDVSLPSSTLISAIQSETINAQSQFIDAPQDTPFHSRFVWVRGGQVISKSKDLSVGVNITSDHVEISLGMVLNRMNVNVTPLSNSQIIPSVRLVNTTSASAVATYNNANQIYIYFRKINASGILENVSITDFNIYITSAT